MAGLVMATQITDSIKVPEARMPATSAGMTVGRVLTPSPRRS